MKQTALRKNAVPAQPQHRVAQGKGINDNSAAAIAQRQRMDVIANSALSTTQLKNAALQRVEDEEPLQGKFETAQRGEDEELLQGKFETAQRVEEEETLQGKFTTAQRIEEEEPLQGKFGTAQRIEHEEPLQAKSTQAAATQLAEQTNAKPNNTGLPDQLKSGIESLSGMSMDHVKVHYNSSQPAQLNAHAYAQGSDIHVAPGQEKHLPHEAWHVVQQAQGRVNPTMQMKMGVPVNDDVGLETEADVMGAKANQAGQHLSQSTPTVLGQLKSLTDTTAQAKLDGAGGTNSGGALSALLGHLERMRAGAVGMGSEVAGAVKVDAFASKLAALKKVAASDDGTAQSAVLDALQKELNQAGVPVNALSTAKMNDDAVQRLAKDATVQRFTGLEIGAFIGAVVGIGALTYGIWHLFSGGGSGGAAPVAAVGYGTIPIPIAQAGNALQIAELERGLAPVVAFTGITSCLGIFRRNGGNISAVHLPLIDSVGNFVMAATIPNLLAAANAALGGGGTYYLVGEADVWLGSGANGEFAAIDGAFGGAHHSFGSGNYSALIDGCTNETVITNNGIEVLRGT